MQLDPNFTVTPELWTISIVQKQAQGLANEHANLVLQSLLFGQVNVMRLHITGSGGKRQGLKEIIFGTNTYLHVEIRDNVERGVAIIDQISLENAVKAVLGVKPQELEQTKLNVHFRHRTWQIKRESALALVTDVSQQEAICHIVKPTFSIFGYESFFNKSRAKGATIINGVIGLGLEIIKPENIKAVINQIKSINLKKVITENLLPIGLLIEAAIAVNNPKAFGLKVYQYPPRSPAAEKVEWLFCFGVIAWYFYCMGSFFNNKPFRNDIGHSCYTWAREMLFKYGDKEIKNDPGFKFQSFDFIAVVTSCHVVAMKRQYITSAMILQDNYQNINDDNQNNICINFQDLTKSLTPIRKMLFNGPTQNTSL